MQTTPGKIQEKSQGGSDSLMNEPLMNDPFARVGFVTRMFLGTCVSWEILAEVDDSSTDDSVLLLLKVLIHDWSIVKQSSLQVKKISNFSYRAEEAMKPFSKMR